MKAYINDSTKSVYVVTDNPTDACHLGFYFARNFPDLLNEGWKIYCVRDFTKIGKFRDVVEVSSAYGLSRVIQACTHYCPQHKAVE